MYKYTTQGGWKTEGSSAGGVHHALRPVPTSFLEPPGHVCESTEELEERDDVPAPLPSNSITKGVPPSCHAGDVGEGVSVVDGLVATDMQVKNSSAGCGGKVLFAAKDKRKLREKRRSTGIAKFNANELQDGETVNNTSYNELSSGHFSTILSSITEPISPENLPENAPNSDITKTNLMITDPHEPASINEAPLNTVTRDEKTMSNNNHSDSSPEFDNSSSGVSANELENNLLSSRNEIRPTEPLSGYLKPCMKRPPIATKPGIASKPAARIIGAPFSGQSQFPINGAVKTKSGQNEMEILTQELHCLKKMLEAERTNNAALKEQLLERDERIKELTIEVMALNEDLDVADEDFIQLEQENNALLQAMAQLNLGSSASS